jgi:hypothetical protein
MREYRVGEHVARYSRRNLLLQDVKAVQPLRCGPEIVDWTRMDATNWLKPESLERQESEAIGRLMMELPDDGVITSSSAEDGKMIIVLDLYERHTSKTLRAHIIVTGDNLGHALWLLREKLLPPEAAR